MSAQINDSHAGSGTATLSGSRERAAYRLVIRARIIPEASPARPSPPTSDRRASVAIGAAVALLLVLTMIWLVVGTFRDEPGDAPASDQQSASSGSIAAPLKESAAAGRTTSTPQVGRQSDSAPQAGGAPTNSALAHAAVPLSPVHEVIPKPPRSALQTIRGTVRVVIRVSIDPEGAVTAANTYAAGPSHYFERLSLEAARKWTFAPANSHESRSMLLRFHFTQQGVTGRAEPAASTTS